MTGKLEFAEIRPRTTGEILDDAWRLYLADAPFLLAASSLFSTPAFLFLIWLLGRPAPVRPWQQWLSAAIGAGLIPVTGLASAVCQEAFRLRVEGAAPGWADCLGAVWRRGWAHAAARALVLLLIFVGCWFLLVPALVIWVAAAAVHPFVAANAAGPWSAFHSSRQEIQRQWGKASAVVFLRLPLLIFTVLNLHMFVRIGLWIGDHLAGLDLAVVGLQLTLKNPVYATALVVLAWLLLGPFIEAANFLLHVDARARYEGLDLWYRVRRHLGTGQNSQLVAGLLAAFFLCLPLGRAGGADTRLQDVRQARSEIQTIRQEVTSAVPYPGGKRWQGRLQALGRRLDHAAPAAHSRVRWFQQEIAGFAQRSREGAVQVLSDLDARLALLQDSLQEEQSSLEYPGEGRQTLTNDQLRQLLPGETTEARSSRAQEKLQPVERVEVKRRSQRGQAQDPVPAEHRGPGLVQPQPGGGFGLGGWMILAGLLLAVLVVSWLRRPQARQFQAAPPAQTGSGPPSVEALLTRPDGPSVAALWHQADEQARGGDLTGAVRILYLAVLALLHRANRIRYERTRTNGEYLRQLRGHEQLQEPFRRITDQFETSWYGDQAGGRPDYAACRSLAETIRALADQSSS